MRSDSIAPLKSALVWTVLVHLVVTFIHGAAHAGAQVTLTPAGMLFVVVIIELGPLAGLVAMRTRPRTGAAVIAATMAASLVFGLVNHFIIEGTDHVGHVTAAWQPLFGWTAAFLVLTEAAGAVLGAWAVLHPIRRTT